MAEEVEIKLRVEGGVAPMRTRIESLGFSLHHPRELEVNIAFDTPEGGLGNQGQLLRLRRWGARSVVTYKGPCTPADRHKRREEIETDVADPAAFETMLRRLGYHPAFRYEKYRAEYARAGEPGLVTLDETPIGAFLEIEGPAAWIDSTARLLGYSASDYITESYGGLYSEHRRLHPALPPDMVFLPASGT